MDRHERLNLAADQTIEASRRALASSREQRIRFKPEALHRIAGYAMPGQLWIVPASPKIGKSSFLFSSVNDWIDQGIKVAVLGLEQEACELRGLFAALRADIPKPVVVQSTWDEYPDPTAYERWCAELNALAEEPYVDRLFILPQRYINNAVLLEAAEQAAEFGARVLVIDHIHHIELGTGGNTYREFGKTVQACKKIAEQYEFTSLVAAQVNRSASQGHRLSRYMPPLLHQIEGGGVIEQNANVVIAPYRPLIVPKNEEEEKLMRQAMKEDVDVSRLLRPNCMGVRSLANRGSGIEGASCLLGYRNGRVTDLPPEVPYS